MTGLVSMADDSVFVDISRINRLNEVESDRGDFSTHNKEYVPSDRRSWSDRIGRGNEKQRCEMKVGES